MSKAIDWLYFRKSCTTCKKAQAYFAPAGTVVKETVDATKVRFGPHEVLSVLEGINTLLVAKGKKVEQIDLKKARPDDDTLTALMLGPSGNLRAPTARIGRTLVVGFNEEMYQSVLG